jgi:tRNA threonylcarbamoyladenosine biosynthesis protein TsaE
MGLPELRITLTVGSPALMQQLGGALATVLRAGDLIILTGELGAGKTTLTRGLGVGLGVRGEVSSPTFVIAREHPPLANGPALVHVDAYRLGSMAELDDLDLDTSLGDAVTVVEWGAGLAEGLAENRLEVLIGRARGLLDREGIGPEDGRSEDGRPEDSWPCGAPDALDGDEPRRVELIGYGRRWAGVNLNFPPALADHPPNPS